MSAYQHLYNLIYTTISSQGLSLLSRILDLPISMNTGTQNNLRIFVLFFSPLPQFRDITVQYTSNIPQFPIHYSHSQPISPNCTTFLLTAISLCVPEVHKCVYCRFISTGSLCRGREFYQLDMTT